MARKRYTPEQIVSVLRQVEVLVANGKATDQACRKAGIVEQTYYRWRKEYGGLKVDQAKRLKELEQENSKLKRLVGKRAVLAGCTWCGRAVMMCGWWTQM
ncbi:transposase-like protein [Silvibacterium bohemicum]|uniref:Transposase-like protein n=1 Tax=Silvibacterium bohemicum TaxID=1577686 RepID=A0A841K0R1_9BACT|nr:transposase-like protein [Silvibacterium bohemicum]